MWDLPAGHPLVRMFAGITEQTFFSTLGIADPPLIDYLSCLLSRFVRTDSLYPMVDGQGQRITDLTRMALEAEQLPPEGRTRAEFHRHVGDLALFWSGFFHNTTDRAAGLPSVVWMTRLGRRSYALAAESPVALDPPNELLARIGDRFELCALGLQEVRREIDEWTKQGPPRGAGPGWVVTP